MSAEPSMEEILSSIKRIIAEEGESPIRSRRPARPLPPPLDDDDAEVLELSDPIGDLPGDPAPIAPHDRPAPATATQPPIVPPAAPPPVAAAAAPIPSPTPAIEEPVAPQEPFARMPDPAPDSILSHRTAEASRSSLDTLSRLLVKPEPGSDGTLEGMVRDMLRPMLREWLDAHLPSMVETMVAAEIARISGQPR